MPVRKMLRMMIVRNQLVEGLLPLCVIVVLLHTEWQ
jgi:hypothetical protein